MLEIVLTNDFSYITPLGFLHGNPDVNEVQWTGKMCSLSREFIYWGSFPKILFVIPGSSLRAVRYIGVLLLVKSSTKELAM